MIVEHVKASVIADGRPVSRCGCAVGEAACGKPARSLAHHIPGTGGVEGVRCSAGSTAAEVARARMALDERGQRLGEAEETSAAMMASAENFAKHAHEVVFHTSNYTFHFIYLFTG